MTGLDKIISQIEEEAKSSADQIIEEAKKNAQEITDTANEECAAALEAGTKNAAAVKEDLLNKSRSAAVMQRKKELLAAKQEVISGVIAKAQASLYELSTEEYFGLIEKMLDRFVTDGTGEVRFNEGDLARLPEGFDGVIAAAAQKKGGSLTVSSETARIDGGFLLVYGGIEENCSFDAVFASERERLQDKVHTLLFT